MGRLQRGLLESNITGASGRGSRRLGKPHEHGSRNADPSALDELDFVEDKTRWGYRFRFGVFKIDEHDFAVIRSAMTA